MGEHSIEVKPAARKELEALPDPVLARVVRKLESLADAPRPAGCMKLKVYATFNLFAETKRICTRLSSASAIRFSMESECPS